MKRRAFLPLVVGFLVLVVGAGLSFRWRAEEPAASAPAPRRVRVATVESGGGARIVSFPGTVRASRRVALGFDVGGRLASRGVEAGERVRRGQVLGRLDDRELRNAATASEAGLEELRARATQRTLERDRVERLFRSGAATSEEVERARADADATASARDAAEARAHEATRRLDEATLRAPFDGHVVEVLAEPGENVNAGEAVVAIAGDGGVEVELGVPESVLGSIVPGDEARARFPFRRGLESRGRVVSIGRASAEGRLYPVIVALDPDGGALPGMAVEIELRTSGQGSPTVPLAAVVNPGGSRPRVFRVAKGRVEAVPVGVGEMDGERVAVTGDLRDGDEVVVAGHLRLVDGDRVEVAR